MWFMFGFVVFAGTDLVGFGHAFLAPGEYASVFDLSGRAALAAPAGLNHLDLPLALFAEFLHFGIRLMLIGFGGRGFWIMYWHPVADGTK